MENTSPSQTTERQEIKSWKGPLILAITGYLLMWLGMFTYMGTFLSKDEIRYEEMGAIGRSIGGLLFIVLGIIVTGVGIFSLSRRKWKGPAYFMLALLAIFIFSLLSGIVRLN